ncbi:RnfH family protein [Ideonella sp. BN130291]|uniref:RnfH family protein n=1 Tax=Ideonella sp. BN130291 TaxID=3112940 RepID=UPI002E25BF9C|nr:RnfH family protein [Ideonella sp. BN130291]
MRIEVAYSPAPGVVDRSLLDLPPGTTLQQALQASGLAERHGELRNTELCAGIWGRKQPLDSVLRDMDRVEVYRPLTVDPKEARRQRYRRQGR